MPRPRKHDTKLPPYVRERHGAYHYDRPGVLTKKLCRVSDGLPTMHEALAATLKSLAEDVPTKGMPRLCVEWERLKHQDFGLLRYRPKVRKEYGRMLKHIGDARSGWFKNFDVHQVKSHHIATVLQTVKEGRRKRYITDDELAIIKANGDAKLGLVIDLAYITGQRIGDLIALTWASVSDKGILFLPSKVEDTTEIPVPVKMTDQLRAVLEGLKGGVEPLPTAPVIRTQTGGRYTYSGMYSAWRRACLPANQTRPRVLNAHIHDLRRKALTDMRDQRGEAAAQALAGHASPEMTRHYMEQTELKWVEPVRLKA
jgi:integrase